MERELLLLDPGCLLRPGHGRVGCLDRVVSRALPGGVPADERGASPLPESAGVGVGASSVLGLGNAGAEATAEVPPVAWPIWACLRSWNKTVSSWI